LGKTNVPLLCQLTEHSTQQLPSKAIIKLTKVISNRKKTSMDNNCIEEPIQQVSSFLNSINIDSITDKPFRYLAVEQVVNSTQLIPL